LDCGGSHSGQCVLTREWCLEAGMVLMQEPDPQFDPPAAGHQAELTLPRESHSCPKL
jgi:hypothetical protein